jgi:glycosyltransferase involved in cell wall biosynthesis
LRFLETGALGIPLVADPFVYDEIEDGATGLLAEWPEEAYFELARLVCDAGLRKELGINARDYVRSNRDIEHALEAWERVFMEVA